MVTGISAAVRMVLAGLLASSVDAAPGPLEGHQPPTNSSQFLMRTRMAGNPPPPRCPLRGGLRGEESGCNPREAEFVVHMRNTF